MWELLDLSTLQLCSAACRLGTKQATSPVLADFIIPIIVICLDSLDELVQVATVTSFHLLKGRGMQERMQRWKGKGRDCPDRSWQATKDKVRDMKNISNLKIYPCSLTYLLNVSVKKLVLCVNIKDIQKKYHHESIYSTMTRGCIACTYISESNTGSLLPPHQNTQTSLALNNAVRNTHLTAQGWQEQHNLKIEGFFKQWLPYATSIVKFSNLK